MHPLFLLTSIGLAFVYLYFINREISVLRSAFKTLPVLILVLGTLFLNLGWLSLALGFSALGDLFLSRKKEDWFIAGLISFLVGHLFYIIQFSQTIETNAPQWFFIGLLVAYSIGFGSVLLKKAAKYRYAILAYMCILGTMGILAIHLPQTKLISTVGALIFIVSDSLLGLRMFVVKDEKTKKMLSVGVWFTYMLAQYLILLGYL